MFKGIYKCNERGVSRVCKEVIQKVKENYTDYYQMPEAANFLLSQLNVFTVPIPIVKIVQEAGFSVYRQNFDDSELSGIIAIDEELKSNFDSAKIISVNNQDNLGHQRFAIAHEFAHYIFDFDKTSAISYYNTYHTSEDAAADKVERRASFFAANLLMPKDLFIKEFEKHSVPENLYETASILANLFQVSASAIDRRIKELGLDV